MKSAVIIFPGINRERDMAHALSLASGAAPTMVWHADTELPDVDLVVVPGGFSYGDYLRCGAIAARSPIMEAVRRHASAGRYVLGVCNGFQILTESGLLPGVLMRNASLKFVCKVVHLRVETAETAFTNAYSVGEVFRAPIAHGEGNYFADPETLARLEGDGRVVLRYCDADGGRSKFANPNGAINDIAGILNAGGNVLGLMPHPENLVEPIQGGTDGLGLFQSIARATALA
jgi:phosphoribosylformylglycinamidine synthase